MLNLFGLRPDFSKIDKVFLSHLHSDHFGDLDAFIVGSWLSGRYTPLHVYGGPGETRELGTAAAVDSVLSALAWDIKGRSGLLPDAGGEVIAHEFDYKKENQAAALLLRSGDRDPDPALDGVRRQVLQDRDARRHEDAAPGARPRFADLVHALDRFRRELQSEGLQELQLPDCLLKAREALASPLGSAKEIDSLPWMGACSALQISCSRR